MHSTVQEQQLELHNILLSGLLDIADIQIDLEAVIVILECTRRIMYSAITLVMGTTIGPHHR